MLTAYLFFDGNAEEAFNFYKSALGGEFSMFTRFSDTEYGAQMPDPEKKKIMHVALDAPGGIKLLGCDYMDHSGTQPFARGNNFALTLHPNSKEEADKFFAALSAGGAVTMPMDNTFWGAYFGMLIDKFGIHWMINHQVQ